MIEKHLNDLTSEPELTPKFLNLSPEETKCFIEKKRLQLCLYFIEKRYHFDGNGVWEQNFEDNQLID